VIYILGAALFGLAYAVVCVRFYQTVSARQPGRAAAYDALIGLLAVAPLQIWAASGSSVWVLIGEVAGSAAGTYLAVRWGR
jgi:hypothetical protein